MSTRVVNLRDMGKFVRHLSATNHQNANCVILVVADDLVPIWHQDNCNHHANVEQSTHFRSVQHNVYIITTWHDIGQILGYSPTPRVTWERADYPMPPRKREGSFGQELIIENVQPEDEGKYECIGINDDVNVQIRFSFNLAVQSRSWVI